jgi:hypothetical protein
LQERRFSGRLGGLRRCGTGMALAAVGGRDVTENLLDMGAASGPCGLLAGTAGCLATHEVSLGSVTEGVAGTQRRVQSDGDEQGRKRAQASLRVESVGDPGTGEDTADCCGHERNGGVDDDDEQ